MTPTLFSPLRLRDVEARNRIGVSPMCQYSSRDGFADDWHLVHLGAFATGGAGIVFTEATAVAANGRISPQDLGVWDDAHVEMLSRIADFVGRHGAVPGMQLAHAGRKASTRRPWDDGPATVPADRGGWPDDVWAPSAVPFSEEYPRPNALDIEGIRSVVDAFGKRGPPRPRRGLPHRGDPRRARLPPARVPLPALEPARGRLRRLLRQPGAPPARSGRPRARDLAGAASRSPCASRRRTGPKAGGTRISPSRSPASSATTASTSWTSPRPGSSPGRRSSSDRAIRCPSRRASAARRASPPRRWG